MYTCQINLRSYAISKSHSIPCVSLVIYYPGNYSSILQNPSLSHQTSGYQFVPQDIFSLSNAGSQTGHARQLPDDITNSSIRFAGIKIVPY